MSDTNTRIAELEAKRSALVDQLTSTDASSISVSAGGGSKSISSRSVAEIKEKIKFIDREIARLRGVCGRIVTIKPRYMA